MTCAGCDDCLFETQSFFSNFHELHITCSNDQKEQFELVCSLLNIKTIQVHTELSDCSILPETMTSHKLTGTNDFVMCQTNEILFLLDQEKITPLRVKLETSPTNDVWKENLGYWETHLEVVILKEQLSELRNFVYSEPNRYISRNTRKDTESHVTIMITVRESNLSKEQYTSVLNSYITKLNYSISRTIIEYCWYDTKMGTF